MAISFKSDGPPKRVSHVTIARAPVEAARKMVEQNRQRDAVLAEARKPGRPRLDVAKVPVTIYLDPAVVAAWQATGKGWRSRLALKIPREVKP